MATMDQLFSDSSATFRAPGAVIQYIDDASAPCDYSDPLWVLQRVSSCLDSALRLFAEGDPEQACRYLAEANFIFERQAEVTSEAGSHQIQESTCSQAEQETNPLARAASA